MKRNSFKKSLNEMRKLAQIMPKSINEAMNFEEADDDMPYDEPEPVENEPEMQDYEQENGPEEAGMEPEGMEMNPQGKELVDQIRKVALQGMADLADSPELPEYEILKKIWQTCDKALIEKKDEKGNAAR